MDFEKLVTSARSYRRFSSKGLPEGFLKRMVNYARLSPSTANAQALKFIAVESTAERDKIFPLLKWAGALKEWDGPSQSERPMGYIIILLDKNISPNAGCDHGITAQSMQLGAAAKGVGCCMIGNFQKGSLRSALELEENFEICLVLAFGYPGEEIVIEDKKAGDITPYYRDEKGVHHVPKRLLEEILIREI